MMRLAFLLSCSFLFYSAAEAKEQMSVGAIIGDPTGLSGRYSLSSSNSVEGALAYSTGFYNGLHIHGTYLWDKARSFETTEGPIDMYYGLGARVIMVQRGKEDGKIAFGPRAPIGLMYNFSDPNIEVFGELSLALDLTPKTDVDLDVGFGARIRF